ncbi:hypothetical protein [Sinorhizobium alkalisoli]|uniref:hypothetical protein n=1 Tax=Sinorhizobium alkalisoli TaxID=1752398 RepID=UPI00124C7003|nr:hypothetical protein [Sinorhizobium alkalisoli]MCA1490880.1 hypothetical protein [Ensifer sp. NBAIM29]
MFQSDKTWRKPAVGPGTPQKTGGFNSLRYISKNTGKTANCAIFEQWQKATPLPKSFACQLKIN